jgi:FKBP-type peptidyl-prolyl cis-trans isomerase
MKRTIFALTITALLASCGVNYEKTKSGLPYKIFPGKGTTEVKPGSFVKMHIKYTLPDTVWQSTYGRVPVFTTIDTGANTAYSYMELLPKCKEGDSVLFTISIDTLKNKGILPEYNKVFKKGDLMKCSMKVLKVYNNEKDVKADYEKETALEKDREIKELEKYLSDKGIKAQKTKSGAFVKVDNAGDQSQKADSGKLVRIMYKGYFSNGEVFDTNLDSSKGHTDPIEFVLKRDPIIPGWEEGIPYFGKGGKGTIYIPAMLGYGMQGREGAIPPYSNLFFDVVITDVKKAPKEQPQQGMNLTPEQMQQLQQQMQQQGRGADQGGTEDR